MTDVVCVGGGEHARVIIEACRTMRDVRVIGFTDPLPCELTVQRLGVPRVDAADERAFLRDAVTRGARLLMGIGPIPGRIDSREEMIRSLELSTEDFLAVVHERAWVAPSARVNAGAAIMANAVVQACADVGAFVVVNTGAVVEHDAVVGAWAHIGPHAAIGGGASIGDRAFIGLGSRVRDHVRVGARAVVGMGAVVVGDVPADARALGVPARS